MSHENEGRLFIEVKYGEAIHIGKDIKIEIMKKGPTTKKVMVFINAPQELTVLRDKFFEKQKEAQCS